MRSLMLLVLLVALAGGACFWLQQNDSVPVPSGVSTRAGQPSGDVGDGAFGASLPSLGPTSGTAAEHGREKVAATGGLVGRLMQAGQPLAGVLVIACKGSSSKAEELERTRTDPTGSFRLYRTGERFWLTADGERVPHHWQSRWLSEDDGIGDVDVSPPGSIAGVVRDEAGAPIAGVKVTRVIASYRTVVLGEPMELSAVSDDRGQFHFDRIGKGDCVLRCQAKGYQLVPDHRMEIEVGEHATTEIVMRRGMTLRGVVLDHVGHPLEGADVRTEDSQAAVTDALGHFVIEDFRRYAEIYIRAKGHLPHEIKWLFDTRTMQRVKLERAATLRGVIKGSKGQPGTVYAVHSDDQPGDASGTRCYEVLYEEFDIVRNGRFELPGFALADFDVTIRIPGVGVCGPVRVSMREDCEVEFEVVPQREVTVSVRNAKGEPIADAELVRDDGIVEYPKRYSVKGDALLKLVAGSYRKRDAVAIVAGAMQVGVPVGEGVAFYVDAPGYLRAAAAAAADALPERIDVVMAQAGRVRGVVHGGMRKAYTGYVSVVELDENGDEIGGDLPASDGSTRKVVASASINGRGAFAISNIAPGSYRAHVSRRNTRTIEPESRGVALIDDNHDARASTDFVVEAGRETSVELTEPALGRLVGRVLLRGAPISGAMVAANRPQESDVVPEPQVRYGSLWERGDWDDAAQLGYVSGQMSVENGGFVLLYRDAGPVEVRVRHADALTTSSAFVIDLPPPGDDVVRDFEIPAGEIRGRYPIEGLSESQRESFSVTLFPSNKTLHDPFFHPQRGGSLAWSCPSIEESPDGRFSFSYLRSGRWLVRVHCSGDVVLWQKVIDVHNDVVDVGDLPVAKPVDATIQWRFQQEKPGKVLGVWLHAPQGNSQSPVWAGTFAADATAVKNDRATCKVMPGKYLVSAFGWRVEEGFDEDFFDMLSLGLTGEEFSKRVPIEVRADGSVTPKSVAFPVAEFDDK